jgi:hypothetical protein
MLRFLPATSLAKSNIKQTLAFLGVTQRIGTEARFPKEMTRTAWPLLGYQGCGGATVAMRIRKTHFEQIPLEKVKLNVEKELQRQKKIKRAVRRKSARKEPKPSQR